MDTPLLLSDSCFAVIFAWYYKLFCLLYLPLRIKFTLTTWLLKLNGKIVSLSTISWFIKSSYTFNFKNNHDLSLRLPWTLEAPWCRGHTVTWYRAAMNCCIYAYLVGVPVSNKLQPGKGRESWASGGDREAASHKIPGKEKLVRINRNCIITLRC